LDLFRYLFDLFEADNQVNPTLAKYLPSRNLRIIQGLIRERLTGAGQGFIQPKAARSQLRGVLGFGLRRGGFDGGPARWVGLPGSGHEQEEQAGRLGFVPKCRPFIAGRLPGVALLPVHRLRLCEFHRHQSTQQKVCQVAKTPPGKFGGGGHNEKY
jgi:hypothetical protein